MSESKLKDDERMLKENFDLIIRKLAKLWLDINLQLTVVGVTGSYGKTGAVRAIASVLSSKFSVNQTEINLDTVYNLPATILKTRPWNEILVLEYGIDHPREMDFHLSLVEPKIAVLTGITSVHTDAEHLGSLNNLIAEKYKLFKNIPERGLGVFNYDDEDARKMGIKFKGRKIFYGLDRKANVWADRVKISLRGTEFVIVDGKEKLNVKTGLIGYPAVYSCLVGYVVGSELGVGKNDIAQRLHGLLPLDGRLSVSPGPLGTTLVNDARRANLASVLAGLKTLAELPGRKVAVLGEMGEIGSDEEKLHRQVGAEAAKLGLDILVGVGPLMKYAIEEAGRAGMMDKQLFWAGNVKEAPVFLKKVLVKGDVLYLKASLLRHLERVLLLLEGKDVCCEEVVCHHYLLCPTCPKLSKSLK